VEHYKGRGGKTVPSRRGKDRGGGTKAGNTIYRCPPRTAIL